MIRQSRRLSRAAACTIAVGLVAAGCGPESTEPSDENTLVVYTGQASDYQIDFNPYSPNVIGGAGSIFEPLFYFNLASDDEPVPRLGTGFSWNEDGTELSVTLREGVTWSDGEAFTADDVVFTLDMVSENEPMNSMGYDGEAEAVNDTEVTIVFAEPSFMQEAQILGRLWIVPEHIWSGYGDPSTNTVEEPVGTGAFTLAEFGTQAFTLEADPGYWGGEPEIAAVRYLALAGNQLGSDALRSGQIDWQTSPVPDIRDFEENYPGYEAVVIPMYQVSLLTCSNTDLGCEGPQTDPAVRHAIYHAIDRVQLNESAFENIASEVSPGFALLQRDSEIVSGELENPIAPMRPSTDKATEVLEDAGWRMGDDGVYARDGERLAMTVLVVTGWTDYITAVDTISQQVAEVGIELTAEQLTWNEWSDMRGQGQYELLMDSLYQGPAPDPYYLYSYFFDSEKTARVGETANPNFARYSSPEVDEALNALSQLPADDAEARQPHYEAVQLAIERDMPYIPILTNGTASQYNTEKFDGWPTEDDLYAYPAIWSNPDASQIFLNLRPTG